MNKKTDKLIQVCDLRKTYTMGKVQLEVLRGVSFEMAAGEFIACYGHSGSGKSTLLHLLGLLDTPTSGEVIFDGQDIYAAPSRTRNAIRSEDVGFIFQFYYLLPELNVLENTLLPGMADYSLGGWRKAKPALTTRAEHLLAELGLKERLKHRPKELSGGERQRVAIARALLNEPKLLLADEPTGNLDSKTGGKIMDLLLKLNADKGQTILMVTHDESLVSSVSRTLHLHDGQLVSGNSR